MNFLVFKYSLPYPPQTHTTKTQDFKQTQTNQNKPAMASVKNVLMALVAEQKAKEEEKNIWADSDWKDIATLESNNVGIVGEQFIQRVCDGAGIEAKIDGVFTKEIGGGAGDGLVKGRTVEIKCARQGTGKGASFQHELGEKPWHAEYMCFIDISPEKFYLTIFPNMTEEQYKTKGFKCPYFPTRSVCWRKAKTNESGAKIGGGAFKLDSTKKLNEARATVENAHTFVWSSPADDANLGAFINRIITPKETTAELEAAMTQLTM